MLNALVVDRLGEHNEKLCESLESAGFTLEKAETGEEAINLAKRESFRLICCANHLEDYSSSEFCSQIRSLNTQEYTTLLVLTEEPQPKSLKQGLLAGATDILSMDDLSEIEIYIKRLSQRETRQLSGRVLFIEDSRVMQMLIMDLLIDMGLDVDTYSFAEEAWDAFQTGDYDLVITDIMLEGSMSGISLVRKIRRLHGAYGSVPIIATSGFENISRRIELFQLGLNDYISKPVIREELRQRVYNHITSYQTLRELQSQRQSLFSLAMLDETTGLFNRHAFREFANKFFSEANRFNRTLSLAVLDIDHMKTINDEFGFEQGDRMLSEIGSWLKRQVRDVDMIARWAGDELVFLFPGCEVDHAKKRMDKILSRLHQFKPANISMTASVGVAELRKGENETLNSLFEFADKAMYQAKMAGRDCVQIYKETEQN